MAIHWSVYYIVSETLCNSNWVNIRVFRYVFEYFRLDATRIRFRTVKICNLFSFEWTLRLTVKISNAQKEIITLWTTRTRVDRKYKENGILGRFSRTWKFSKRYIGSSTCTKSYRIIANRNPTGVALAVTRTNHQRVI